jgi:hypothetical protein
LNETILDKAWEAGIPHVVFTGGEPTLRDSLVDLIAHAESNSQVTGLLSDGIKLANPEYLNHLLMTGLDHLTIILRTEQDTAWEALENSLAADLFVVVHLTITPENAGDAPGFSGAWLRWASRRSPGESDPELNGLLDDLRHRSALLNLDLVWICRSLTQILTGCPGNGGQELAQGPDEPGCTSNRTATCCHRKG